MYGEERLHAIATLVEGRRRVSVSELASTFSVTAETIRRDLSALEGSGVLRRVHGGAVAADVRLLPESAIELRDETQRDAKAAIARAALSQLPADGATVLLDAGSSVAALAGLLPRDRRLTVYTHAVPVASRLLSHPGVQINLLPGRIRPLTHAAVGADTVAAIRRLHADVLFVGTNALTLERGLSTPDAEEAATKAALVDAAARVVVLADATKWGIESTVQFAPIEAVDCVVSDPALGQDAETALRDAGVDVVIA